MIKQNHTYTVKGISHHDVAGKLGVWLPECVGLPITLRRESASENEIGVESVAVYLIDEHLGYVDEPMGTILQYDIRLMIDRLID